MKEYIFEIPLNSDKDSKMTINDLYHFMKFDDENFYIKEYNPYTDKLKISISLDDSSSFNLNSDLSFLSNYMLSNMNISKGVYLDINGVKAEYKPRSGYLYLNPDSSEGKEFLKNTNLLKYLKVINKKDSNNCLVYGLEETGIYDKDFKRMFSSNNIAYKKLEEIL